MKIWNIILLVTSAAVRLTSAPSPKLATISYGEAQPVISALEEVLPEELKGKSAEERPEAWAKWIARYEATSRTRLTRGDEDSLVNFLLYGTSFTKQRRLSAEDFKSAAIGDAVRSGDDSPAAIIQKRVEDLVDALSSPAKNERLQFLRGLVESGGRNISSPAGRAAAKKYVVDCLLRVLEESGRYAAELEEARRKGDVTQEFAERSTLFHDRGISLDTTLLPDFAIEESLREMRDRGLISPGGTLRVAILGPGLDFTDKDAGFDLYPLQTIQPFAVMDSLLRLGLAPANRLEVSALDLSPRVIEHISLAQQRAKRGEAYSIHLVRDPRLPWKAEPVKYWNRFGDQLGTIAPAGEERGAPPGLAVRTVRIRPALISRIQPIELNIVTQRVELPDADRYDLIVATNIFVYYGVFEQCLALANVQRMLRPGGFLLSNNILLEIPATKIHAVDYRTVIYSNRRGDGDHIVWYRRDPD